MQIFGAMAERFSIEGLVGEWDAVELIRSRVRGGGFLEDDTLGSDPSNKSVVLNAPVLIPLLVRMTACHLQLPGVEQLRSAVSDFYDANQRVVDESRVDDTAWFCRRCVVHVKRKAQKKLVSLAPWFNHVREYRDVRKWYRRQYSMCSLLRITIFKSSA